MAQCYWYRSLLQGTFKLRNNCHSKFQTALFFLWKVWTSQIPFKALAFTIRTFLIRNTGFTSSLVHDCFNSLEGGWLYLGVECILFWCNYELYPINTDLKHFKINKHQGNYLSFDLPIFLENPCQLWWKKNPNKQQSNDMEQTPFPFPSMLVSKCF